jgi:hypothetical protein
MILGLSRKEWFERHILPIFKTRQPNMHITYDMFGNKSRNEDGFDHRTKSVALRQAAGALHDAELAARDAEGTDEFYEKNVAVYDKYLEFLELEDAVNPHKTSWVRRYKKVDWEMVNAVLPDFTELEFKCWTSRPEDHEDADMLKLKFKFREAYQYMLKNENSPTRGEKLREWDAAQKAFYRRK